MSALPVFDHAARRGVAGSLSQKHDRADEGVATKPKGWKQDVAGLVEVALPPQRLRLQRRKKQRAPSLLLLGDEDELRSGRASFRRGASLY